MAACAKTQGAGSVGAARIFLFGLGLGRFDRRLHRLAQGLEQGPERAWRFVLLAFAQRLPDQLAQALAVCAWMRGQEFRQCRIALFQ